jgi:hypothetical protein
MNIFFKHEKFFLLCIFLNNALMAMDNNVKLLPRTEQEKFQPKKLIRIKGNENNGNTFWFDRKLLAPCAWLDQMLMLSESESLAHNDPKQPLVLPTATSTSLFQFKQLLQDLYKFDNQVPQSTTSASNSENESTSSFISLLLHSIPFNFSSTKSNIPEDNNSKQDFTETVHQRWKSFAEMEKEIVLFVRKVSSSHLALSLFNSILNQLQGAPAIPPREDLNPEEIKEI